MERAKPIKNFDAELFHKLVEKMTVYEGNRVVVTLVDGSECEVDCG